MTPNVGVADRAARVVLGLALLSFIWWGDGAARWFGLIGLIPLATGLVRWCPLYTLLGWRTCPTASPLHR